MTTAATRHPKPVRPPSTVTDRRPRCSNCRKLLAEMVTRPWVLRCPRCKHVNTAEGPVQSP